LGILAGIVAFGAILGAVEWLAHQTRPSLGNGGMLAVVLAAYFVSALAGGIVAGRIARRPWAAWVIALFVLAGVAWTIATLPQPVWMQAGSVIAPLLAGFLAHRMLLRPARSVHATA
jgi:hypothetical protein